MVCVGHRCTGAPCKEDRESADCPHGQVCLANQCQGVPKSREEEAEENKKMGKKKRQKREVTNRSQSAGKVS